MTPLPTCCGHPLPLADCSCPDCGCWWASQDAFDLPIPGVSIVAHGQPVDLDDLGEAS